MRLIVPIVLLATMVFGAPSRALAQAVEAYPDQGYYYYEEYETTPRVYEYRSDRPVVVHPVRPANCGEYRYWNGTRCVDARVVPPDVR
jgi:hypothetical protein